MSEVVIDASVAAKWFFPEPHSDQARKLLSAKKALVAPDLIRAEFANIIWKRCRKDEISTDQAEAILSDFLRILLQVSSSEAIISAALGLALQSKQTVYDCLYLALAMERGCPLVTGDERFIRGLFGGPFARHARWIGTHR